MDEQKLVERMLDAYRREEHFIANTHGMKAAMKVCMEARDAQWEKAILAERHVLYAHDEHPDKARVIAEIKRIRSRLSEPERVERVTVGIENSMDTCGVFLDGVHQINLCRRDAERYARGLKAELADKE
jgi:hypothetical protein